MPRVRPCLHTLLLRVSDPIDFTLRPTTITSTINTITTMTNTSTIYNTSSAMIS